MFKKTILLSLLLALLVQGSALAAEQYYVDNKIKGYNKGDFVVLEADDINFRASAGDGKVLKVLPHHALLRVIRHNGDWMEAQSDSDTGYIYASFTGAGAKDGLTPEDFAVGYAALGQRFDVEQAEAKLGKVVKLVDDKKHKQKTYTFISNVVLGVTKQAVTSIRVYDPKYITMRGVSVGDSAGRAVGQYGVPDTVIYDKDKTIYEYFFQDGKKQTLRFALEINAASKVQAFILESIGKK